MDEGERLLQLTAKRSFLSRKGIAQDNILYLAVRSSLMSGTSSMSSPYAAVKELATC